MGGGHQQKQRPLASLCIATLAPPFSSQLSDNASLLSTCPARLERSCLTRRARRPDTCEGRPRSRSKCRAADGVHRATPRGGALGCFSFFPTKILGALGDAGLVVTNDATLAARCRRLRQHGAQRRGEYVEVGGNFRLDEIQAAALRVKLGHVGEWIAARRAHGAAYDAAFHGLSGLEALVRGEGWNGSIYSVRVLGGRREALRAHLAERGVETAVYYDRPLHLQPALAQLGIGPGAFPESERAGHISF
jgi:dTDP-4-amino-4,6-dideoxygalactose transaminase